MPSLKDAAFGELCLSLPASIQAPIASLTAELIYFVAVDRYIEGVRVCAAIEKLCADDDAAPAAASPDDAGDEPAADKNTPTTRVRNYLLASDEYVVCLHKAGEAQALIDYLTDEKGWNRGSVDAHGYGTYYRAEPALGSHSFKIIGLVDVHILKLASVLIEIGLFHIWFPMCAHSEEVGSPSRLHKFGRFTIKAPWPVAYRDCFVEGYGVDDMTDNRRVVIVGKSITTPEQCPEGIPFVAPANGHVRATIHHQGFILEPRGDKTYIAFVTNVDPHIRNMPMAIMNYISGKIVWVLLSQMEKAAKKAQDPTSEHAKRMAQSPEIYAYFAARLPQVMALWGVFDGEAAARTAMVAEEMKVWREMVDEFATKA